MYLKRTTHFLALVCIVCVTRKLVTGKDILSQITHSKQSLVSTVLRSAPAQVPAVPAATETTLCQQCWCPSNPYMPFMRINCFNLSLTSVPILDEILRTSHSGVADVHLSMENNNIKMVSRFAASTAIDEIVLKNSNVEIIEPYAFAGLTQLRRLDLANNKLTVLDRHSFCGDGNSDLALMMLDLGYNDLHTLDDELFACLPNLAELHLSGAPLMAMDASTTHALLGASALRMLSLDNTGLSNLEMNLKPVASKLEFLNLSGNKIASVPEVLQFAASLTELILDQNYMHELDSLSFKGMDKLERLDIAYTSNLFIIYNGTFQNLTALKVLNINGNPRLSIIEQGSFPNKPEVHLEQLDLSYNNLTQLDEELFEGYEIDRLILIENPLICSCHIQWIIVSPKVDANTVTCIIQSNHSVVTENLNFATLPCPGDNITHKSFSSIHETFSMLPIFFTVGLLLSFFVLLAIVVVLFRPKSEWQYSVLSQSDPTASDSI